VTERLFVRLAEDASHGPESSAPAASLRPLPVRRTLRSSVASILSYSEQFAAGEEVVERVLPDGAVRLILHAGNSAGDNAFVAGSRAGATLVRLYGRVQGLSVALQPGAATALFGMPAGELAELTVPLQDLWPREGRALLDDVAAHRADDAKALVLQQALSRRLSSGASNASRAAAQAAVQAIQASAGRRRLRDIAAMLGVGERRLQQLFHEQVGLSPKAVSRLARLHHLLRALRGAPSPAWAELAPDLGFYDQAHLANEFRALCGLTPGQFLMRSASGSSKTPR
jgi:AraC-like DNA-binding protein